MQSLKSQHSDKVPSKLFMRHGFEDVDQLNIFCNGLKPETKMILDVAAGGTMMTVDVEQATRIITALSVIDRQIEALTKQMSKLPQQLNVVQTPYVHQQQGPHPSLHERQTKLEETLEKFMQVFISNQKNTDDSIRNLETQVGQLAKQMAEQNSDRQQFSANTQTNPKEHCKSITTRCGKVIGKGIGENLVVDDEVLRDTEVGRSEKITRETQKGEVINIPFMEKMEQMFVYAKFMKDLLTKKRKFSKETVTLEAGIGDLEIKPTMMTLQISDRSVKYSYGVVEDVLVKVDGLVFPVDFVIMDIEEDKEFSLILGRPLMKTARVIINVDDGKLKVRVEDQEVNFNVFWAMHHLRDKQHCFRVDVIGDLFMVNDIHLNRSSPLEKVLRGDLEGNNMDEDKMIKTCLAALDVSHKVVSNQNHFEELGKEKESKAPKVEFNVLPSHLKYVFLEEGG
ncbi:PREDICTED: uncharacterized protein LOC109335455 [Lupinus angustifolius]|uniref:uncharacterized protein LOC109335455 n=1 Tax=Lupinus angustifolius TaxID=3871 RepID=UPI00092F7CD3|nr:PREDICTED: uncharacterized protein LOC109335455 [Lupinus angustifolius]